MKRIVCVLSMLLPLLLPIPAMSFCAVPQPRLVCAEYFASQIVVKATLIQTRQLHDKDEPDYPVAFMYTLRVNQVLRGHVTGTLRVFEENDSSRAPFVWVPGRNYLLFLSYDTGEKSWELDGCGNSARLGKAGATLSQIDAIKAAHGGGLIQGVVGESGLGGSIPGVRVEARGKAGRFSAITNDQGEFRLHVPAGQYRVRAFSHGVFFKASDYTYEDPRHISIEPGGCAQVQFARNPN